MRQRTRRPRHIVLVALTLFAWASASRLASADEPAATAVKLGTLDAETWQSAQGLVPEEFLNRYKDGQWTHDIYEAPPGTLFADPDFIAAGKDNVGRFAIGAKGELIEVATGKQPASLYGPPFPDIDPNDPQAGSKVLWNFFYQSYALGNSHNFINLDWVGTRGRERSLVTQVDQRFFDGQPPAYQPTQNPQNFLFQQYTLVSKPADLQGTVSLTHRFREPDKRDQVWTYVPALRRVRAVSPVNRSDGFLGSDVSQDDGSYFDGKPEDFTWKLVGEGEFLVMYDRAALIEQTHTLRRIPKGGFVSTDSLRSRFAYQLDGWTGFAWAPLSKEFVLVKRPVWIVEGKPKDPYYLFGKLILRFDKEGWRGTYSSKYDWKGQVLNSYLPVFGTYFPVDGEWRTDAACVFTMSQNWRMNRATVGYPDPSRPESRTRVALPDSLFNVDTLIRMGK